MATATGTTIWVEARAVLGLEPALHPSMEAATTAKVKVASKMLARRFAGLLRERYARCWPAPHILDPYFHSEVPRKPLPFSPRRNKR